MLDIDIRSPRPFDLVGGAAVGRETVPIAFVSFGSSGGLHIRVRDANGAELATSWPSSAGSGEFGGPYAFEIPLPAVPTTKYGTVEFSRTLNGPPEQVILVVFGSVVMPQYFTYKLHTVRRATRCGTSPRPSTRSAPSGPTSTKPTATRSTTRI